MVDLTHARHDRAHVLAPGLWRSLGPGDRRRLKLDVTYRFGPGEQIEFKGFEPLGADDMRVMQGLVALAGRHGLRLEDEEKASQEGRQLMLALFEPAEDSIRGARIKPTSLIVQDSLRRLAREIGMDEGGKTLSQIRRSIERLFATTVFIQNGKTRTATRLLSKYASNDAGDLYVALNPRITSAVLGRSPHARIDLTETRALSTDHGRLIHQRLSGWIDPGKSGEASLVTLEGYVWPDEAPTDRASRARATKVRKAIVEIENIGWRVESTRRDCWRFIRPR